MREGLENEDRHTRGKPKDGQDEKQQTNIECRQDEDDTGNVYKKSESNQ